MNRILASSGEPRTIRNVLRAYAQLSSPDDWYTLRSGDNRYRISLARHHRVTSPAGVTQTVVSTNDFGIHLPGSEGLSAGWVVESTSGVTAKVLVPLCSLGVLVAISGLTVLAALAALEWEDSDE